MSVKIYSTTAIIVFLGAFSVSTTFVSAQTASPDLQTVVLQLQEQIKILEKQVEQLKVELAEVKAEIKFTKTLYKGTSGDDVRELQEFLKQFPDIYPEGLVTGYFGPLTEKAVQ